MYHGMDLSSRASRPRRGRRTRLTVGVGALLVASSLITSVASAQTTPTTTAPPIPVTVPPYTGTTVPGPDPTPPADTPEAAKALFDTLAAAPDQPPSPDDPFVAVVNADKDVRDLGLARLAAQDRSYGANKASVLAATARNIDLMKEVAAEKVRDRATHKLAVERKRMSALSVRAYVTGGDSSLERTGELLDGDTTDPASGRQIMFDQVLARQRQVTDAARAALAKAKRRLAAARRTLAEAQREADARAATAADLASQAASAAQSHDAAVAAAAQARRDLQAAGSKALVPVPLETALIGLPRLTAEDLAEWFATTSYRPRVATPIPDYARWFIEEGQAEGIRGDIAFAQAVLETGGFSNNDSVNVNNFSGIGHCDSCASGWAFASPELGVRAQIQLLKSYAIKKPEYASPLVDKRLHGPAGCCPTWGDLTKKWATDPGYGPKISLIYTSIVDFALKRRAAGLGLEPTI
jgi:hypothetical protein